MDRKTQNLKTTSLAQEDLNKILEHNNSEARDALRSALAKSKSLTEANDKVNRKVDDNLAKKSSRESSKAIKSATKSSNVRNNVGTTEVQSKRRVTEKAVPTASKRMQNIKVQKDLNEVYSNLLSEDLNHYVAKENEEHNKEETHRKRINISINWKGIVETAKQIFYNSKKFLKVVLGVLAGLITVTCTGVLCYAFILSFSTMPALAKCNKFAVTAVDRISSENRLKLEEFGINVCSLLAFSDDNFSEQVKHIRVFEPLDTCLRKSETISDFIKQQEVKQGNNARLGFWCSFGIEERALARSLYEQYKEEIKNVDKILVLGTEEFMSVPIYFAREIESHQKEVVCHSTARSPIGVNNTLAKYPITKGYKLPSFYDVERLSYLYHMEHYDLIFILTDSKSIPKETIKAMSYLMSIYKNYNTQLIQFK